jgi:hypothetical protein
MLFIPRHLTPHSPRSSSTAPPSVPVVRQRLINLQHVAEFQYDDDTDALRIRCVGSDGFETVCGPESRRAFYALVKHFRSRGDMVEIASFPDH